MRSYEKVIIDEQEVCWQDVVQVARYGALLELSDSVWEKIDNAQKIVQGIVESGENAYGINTGLGSLCDVSLTAEQLSKLSRNTVLSHACGVGPILPDEQCRAIMCAAVVNYSKGKSGIHRNVVKGLLDCLNRGITPQVPSQGSVGYLTHMAHIGVCLLGIGNVSYQGKVISTSDAFLAEKLEPITLGAKDGLSLVNGTPCMTGLSCLALDDTWRLSKWADVISALSFEALKGQQDALDPEVLLLKPYEGVQIVGHNLRSLLNGSKNLIEHQGIHTQDALSIRAIPQVHGAVRDQLKHAAMQVNTELNSATDNPLILGTPDNYRVVSQANPHGESVAMAADLMSISIAELGGISERRLDRLINPLVSGLPAYLVSEPGANSGMMIVQYVVASLCSENKRFSIPAVTDNYVTSALQEDHLSMGTTAALKLLNILENTNKILAVEYLCAAQACEFIDPSSMGKGSLKAWQLIRQSISSYNEDRWLAPEIEKSSALIRDNALLTTHFSDIQ
ncbi:histidine ammonia-lyase [Marinomonas sp. 5E14-1]|uniref:HAL/PAL/TAL family ammonia-lyase n=1 Tax=Marinomonas sp. 5E14-1 TaxID=3153922 RepID=UPI003267A1F6